MTDRDLLDGVLVYNGQEDEPRYQGDPEPLCPHGCYKRKPMHWAEDQWYCPKYKNEFVADPPHDKVSE